MFRWESPDYPYRRLGVKVFLAGTVVATIGLFLSVPCNLGPSAECSADPYAVTGLGVALLGFFVMVASAGIMYLRRGPPPPPKW